MTIICAVPTNFITAASPYKANAVHYNGTTDYLTIAGALTGAADGPRATISVWLKATNDGVIIFTINNSKFISLESSSVAHKYFFSGAKAGPTVIANITANTVLTPPSSVWHHFVCSYDVSLSTAKFYVDGSDVTSFSGFGTGNVLWTSTGPTVAALPGGTSKYSGDMAELWADQTYIDLSVSANLAKFRNATTGKPVSLGVNGELITGSSPLVYLPNVAASVGTNKGTGGNFTINGTPSAASTSPSD